jgi:hypothetical protein
MFYDRVCAPCMSRSAHLCKLVFRCKYANLITSPGKCAQQIFPEGANPLQASWRSLLVSRKLVVGDNRSEGSETIGGIAHNGCSYAQCEIAWLCLYQPIQNLPAGTELAKPLKPALRMSYTWVHTILLIYFVFIIILSELNPFPEACKIICPAFLFD